MSISKLFKSILCATILVATSVAANATTIDFTFNINGGGQYGSGNFTGTDLNNDGFLTLNELTTFNGFITKEGSFVSLPSLFQFSAFDLTTDTWNTSPLQGNTGFHIWFSWNNGGNAVFNSAFNMNTTVVSQDAPASVPEPLTLGLFAIGLLGLGVVRRRKN
ncbi:PEP-CTERM sorting domain-containing protein [Undibacterium sp.]|jgi:hypothetical protein|uniref:PEP-CTERM sorting domain-containing protein n=1 Tax=Undibacterium sp. TaxID=1914977 RepID=UPI002B6F91EA|nr:PEP-CTERM sorting domain-containing protein [Undibacterium sp.]HTD05719.1 PEP-CTERM sorting domain-containing protein [Undibacterium sp.]